MDISELLAFSVKNKASDLHLSAGLPPLIRVHGDVRRINLPPLDHNEVHDYTTRWAKADAFVPAHELIGGGKPTFIDVTVARADAALGRSASYTPIEDLLLDLVEKGKRDHYVDELAPGGPGLRVSTTPTSNSSLSSSRGGGASASRSRPMLQRCSSSSPGRRGWGWTW